MVSEEDVNVEITQNSTDRVTTLPHTEYDAPAIIDFIDSVFHSKLEEGEEILTWATTGVPGYPISVEDMTKKLRRSKKHMAFYIGTATCKRGVDGGLYNRKALFHRLHVVVLDDIGTKIDKASLPPDLDPSYIIQTSDGNEQWGFVLDEPIANLDHAQLFVTLVYHSGFTDTGGNMPTKLVRMPCGYNMKKGRENIPVKLLVNDGPLWSPDQLLAVLQTGVTWDDIISRPEFVSREKLTKVQGATPWSPVYLQAPSVRGIVDPGLEWMYLQNMVYQERDEWVDIRCPWYDEHTEKGPDHDKAGYSPMGWGEGRNAHSRGFNCFHHSCAARTSSDFVEYVAGMGGPELATYDYVPELTSRYVYDPYVDGAWDMYSSGGQPIRMTALNNLHAKKIAVADSTGGFTKVNTGQLWKSNDARVVVEGAEYYPGSRSKLFEDMNGDLRYNLFNAKEYDQIVADRARVKPFYDYLDYLIPDPVEREYFTGWLACKVQDPMFRGAAMFMVANQQGIGRNTLADMIALLFGQAHVKQVPFGKLIKGDGFNSYLESLFVVVNETLSLDDLHTHRRASDILKELVDPRPQRITINPKYGAQRDVWTVASFLFLSNHDDGLSLTENDRRFYAIRNADDRAPPAYFKMINKWMKDGGWEEHLWNDLMSRDVDAAAFSEPPEASETMQDVVEESRSPLDIIIGAYVAAWPTGLVPKKPLDDLVTQLSATPGLLPEAKVLTYVLPRAWKAHTRPAHRDSSPVRMGGSTTRCRVKPGAPKLINADHPDWGPTRMAIDEYDGTKMLGVVIAQLEAHGKKV